LSNLRRSAAGGGMGWQGPRLPWEGSFQPSCAPDGAGSGSAFAPLRAAKAWRGG